MIYTTRYETPWGTMVLGDIDGKLCLCDWDLESRKGLRRKIASALSTSYTDGVTALLNEAVKQLDGYFSGRLKDFDIPTLMIGTPFQRRVWGELCKIQYGATSTYGKLAKDIGQPQGCRAVASAARANPISIIVPCHRLIGADGKLTGYAGGLDAKSALIELEKTYQKEP